MNILFIEHTDKVQFVYYTARVEIDRNKSLLNASLLMATPDKCNVAIDISPIGAMRDQSVDQKRPLPPDEIPRVRIGPANPGFSRQSRPPSAVL